MRRPATSLVTGILLVLSTSLLRPSPVFAQPKIIARMSPVPHDAASTFKTLKRYFSDPGLSNFQLVSADPATHTIVAKRSGIDTATWGQWAYCSLGPMHMLDTLTDAAVTLKVKIEPSVNNASYVTVNADFQGTYGLGNSESTTQCISNGVLEENILATAGAASSEN